MPQTRSICMALPLLNPPGWGGPKLSNVTNMTDILTLLFERKWFCVLMLCKPCLRKESDDELLPLSEAANGRIAANNSSVGELRKLATELNRGGQDRQS